MRTVARINPDVILHAAYEMTAGSGPNIEWTNHLLDAAQATDARFIFISTDLVFGATGTWHAESDTPNPTLPYGKWKAALERQVLEKSGIVARTALVWGIDPVDQSTQTLVLDPLRAGSSPRLFDDEWRTPTEVHDLADALIETFSLVGPHIFHCAGPERLTRLQFGRMLARHFGYDPASIPPSSRIDFAPDRPADTSLALCTTSQYLKTRFRGPSEVLGISSSPTAT